jgi:hypothetical protein
MQKDLALPSSCTPRVTHNALGGTSSLQWKKKNARWWASERGAQSKWRGLATRPRCAGSLARRQNMCEPAAYRLLKPQYTTRRHPLISYELARKQALCVNGRVAATETCSFFLHANVLFWVILAPSGLFVYGPWKHKSRSIWEFITLSKTARFFFILLATVDV